MRLRPLTLGFVLWGAGCSACLALLPSRVLAAETENPGALVIHAAVASKPPKGLGFSVAGQSPDGHVLSANARYLTRDGKPWVPVMGEFHFSRYPETGWEEETLKM